MFQALTLIRAKRRAYAPLSKDDRGQELQAFSAAY